MPQDQQHPQEKTDQEVVNTLLTGNPDGYNLAELARLRIRYQNFPGARQIQRDLDLVLQRWGFTEEQLFEQTRQLHQTGKVYERTIGETEQDWS